jgi:type II secretory pathway component PulF
MKTDEFAFFNQQLAAMLRDGIPLEGALQRLSAEMRDGGLRAEVQALADDLSRGMPLKEAIHQRDLPELYRCLVAVGAQSNDLPGVLTLIADHYHRRYTIWTRLKGLMTYPLIVLAAAFGLSIVLAQVLDRTVWPSMAVISSDIPHTTYRTALWIPPVLLGAALALAVVLLSAPAGRRALRWRVPSFRESSLAQIGATLALLLRNGVPLDAALALVERMESGSCAAEEIAVWRQRLAAGHAKFADMAPAGRAFPPLFIWLVAHGREDLGSGFQRAADLYQSRANHRADLLLYSALPCSVIALGIMIVLQVQPVFHSLVQLMNALGGSGLE